MKNKFTKYIFKQNEYKVLYKRLLFTCLILFIYILGSNISLIAENGVQKQDNTFYKIAVSNMGGDIHTLNIFSLGLGPWLTALIFFSLLAYKNMDKASRQTRKEKHYKEKILTLVLSIIQGYFVIHEYVIKDKIHSENIFILLLVIVTGTMLLVWLADQNVRYGVAGPMPIVLMSIVKSLFQQKLATLHTSTLILVFIVAAIVVALFILLVMELIEYRINYRDIMNFENQEIKKYLAWKINPAGSISIMISVSVFIILNNVLNLLLSMTIQHKDIPIQLLTFNNATGITLYMFLQIILGYLLSRFILNTKNKSKDFLRSGNYFVGIQPGEATERFLNKKARKICWIGSIIVACIIAVPLYSTLFVPQLAQQIYFAIQLIVLVYIGINIAETIKTYLYFDKYKRFLNKYW
ncbi:preprotein translocase subunit SecY [Staphylococcus caeli]|uniref:Accessory Sec system protein translocase subunit SecY2 n=1 Tax=Staphylococcus caeli TaxID=2201815 RepID=A0A1D4K169_9STAP|nr:preprotein translocase subunit SecY [Staphylococcus caeli]SCS85323.1 preprotein translocase subunit SecY [Staphylococcus caeli]